MKLSEDTIKILKNFSAINASIIFKEGNTIKSLSESKNIMASAKVTESFPTEFGVYDLNKFLSVVGMFSAPELRFSDDMTSVSIVDSHRSVKYFFSDTNILSSAYPSRDIVMPTVDLEFVLSEEDLLSLRKAAGPLDVSDIVITNGKSKKIIVKATDTKDATSNSFELEIDNVNVKPDEDFSFIFNINNLKVIHDSYTVSISNKLISRFTNSAGDVTYYIALEKNSTVGQ
jgi:hypothetical protein